ncbi:MAG: hypothetical protein M0C28_11480 [Candidatus Moduliflexus flocculans]|nr:hypothetical protein [Candidatus Moduliflexus flocculans]
MPLVHRAGSRAAPTRSSRRASSAATRVFAFSNLAALINYSATFAIGFLLSLYLQYIKGFTPRGAGLVLDRPARGHGPVLAPGRPPLRPRSSPGWWPRWAWACAPPASWPFAWLGPASGLLGSSSASLTARRPRLRPLLLAQHQRRHGRGRAAAPRRGLGRPRHHAPDRAR